MIGSRLFNLINIRLQEYKQSYKLFGGVSLILVGDLFQLKPVLDAWIFVNIGDLKHFQDNLFLHNFAIHELKEIMRQKDDVEFATLLNKIRENKKKHKIDLSLIESRVVDPKQCPKNATRLFTNNDNVNEFNITL